MMLPIAKIALRRIKNNLFKDLFLVLAIFFSMMMISFFVFFELQTLVTQNPAYQELPFTEFMDKVRTCMNITIVFLILITFITIRMHCSRQSEENTQILAVLTSIGATGAQKRKLIFMDIVLLYLPATLLGILIGIIPGIKTGDLFHGVTEVAGRAYLLYASTAIALAVFSVVMILLCNYLPSIQIKRKSVIQAVRKLNVKAAEQKHGYRQSQTYRSQALLKRSAKKSIDYYSKNYNGIALSFATAALYPVLGVLLLRNIGSSEVIIDANPYDGFDTSASVLAVVDNMLLFLAGCFLILTIVGLIQAIITARIQAAARRNSAHAYLSVGMVQSDVNKMIRYEFISVACRSAVVLIFGVLLVNACFGVVLV